jgi:urea carboxylase
MFDKLLIANRGAIACRILRTLRALNVEGVAVYSEADAASLHILQADQAHSLGEGGAAGTYLAVDKILAIARSTAPRRSIPATDFFPKTPPSPKPAKTPGSPLSARRQSNCACSASSTPPAPWPNNTACRCSKAPSCWTASSPRSALANDRLPGDAQKHRRRRRHRHACVPQRERTERVVRRGQTPGAEQLQRRGVFIEKYIQRARHLEVQVFGDGRAR